MKKGIVALAVIVGLAVLIGFMAMGTYNRLVGLDEAVDTAWSQVENVYQRRADLVPNLVATVKGASEFEQETLTKVIEARAQATQVKFDQAPSADQLQQFETAQSGLSSALSRLLVTVERYPELKAVDAFRDLQAQLEGTENRITVERQKFNVAAQEFNTARRKFPAVLIANMMGFTEKAYFKSTPGSEAPPKVEF
ncbi:MAG: LemA family protein [Polyangiales bacterium]